METMTTSIILPFLVFFPFLGAVISYIIGRSNKGARDIWCWILSAVIFIASLTLIGKETVYSLRGFCGLGLSFAADGFGVILAVLTGAIWLITTIFSKEYMAAERNRHWAQRWGFSFPLICLPPLSFLKLCPLPLLCWLCTMRRRLRFAPQRPIWR